MSNILIKIKWRVIIISFLSKRILGRDTHGLFDYEATTFNFSLMSLSSESVLIRKENDVRIISPI